MLQHPQWKPHFRVEIITGEGVVLLSELDHALLPGALPERLAPLLDGTRTREEIAAQLNDVARDELNQTLATWQSKGYIGERDDTPQGDTPASDAVFWSLQGMDARAAKVRLKETVVSLRAFGDAKTESLEQALRALGVQISDEGELAVALTDDYLREGLGEWNEAALNSGRAWMLARLVGTEIRLGPIFLPDTTACWECLAQRLRANSEVESFVRSKNGGFGPLAVPRAASPANEAIAANMAASEIARWIARENSPLEGKILSFDLRSWRAQSHDVVWRPQCPACGYAPELEELAQITPRVELQSGAKVLMRDGGHRSVSPEETLDKYLHHVSPICGAVTSLQRQTVENEGIVHAYSASHNFALGGFHLESLRKGLRTRAGGKGTSDAQAKAGGLCEALERYCGVFRGEEPRRRAKMKDLGDAAIHPNACLHFSERQYDERADWNARGSRYHSVPARFDADVEIEWSPVWSLTRGEARWLPTAFCYYLYPQHPRDAFCHGDSNGNAAGNTLEEAVLQGFLELVERDSVALWWYNRLPKRGVDLDSFNEPYFAQVREFLQSRGRDLWLLDLTADLKIPAFVACSKQVDSGKRIMIGFGCHLDARIAALRAVTELNQMLSWILREESGQARNANSADENSDHDRETLHWLENATPENQPYLAPMNEPLRAASEFLQNATDDLRGEVEWCRRAVEARGLEMLVLDQTRSDIGLPVVKVIVPGMRHFWARYAPGRLYDVPVEMGWLATATREENLNPIPMFI